MFGNLADLTDAGRGEVGVPARRAVAADGLDRPGRRHLVAGARRRRPPDRAADPTGVRTRTTYDPAGRLTAVDDGLVVTGTRARRTGPARRRAPRADGTTRARSAYDRCGRRGRRDRAGRRGHPLHLQPGRSAARASRRRPGARSATCTTPAGGWPRRVDGDGQRWELRHDPDGLLVERISPTGLVETLDRDAAGRVTRHHVPGRGTTAYAYDPAGRVVAVADRAGRREFTRDAAGRVVAATDALGHTTRYTYDQRGNLVAVTDPLGGRTRYAHDELRPGHRRHRPARADHPLRLRRRRPRAGTARPDRRPAPRGPTTRPAGRARHRHRRRRSVDDRRRARRARPAGPHHRDPAPHPPIELRWDAAGRLVERRAGDTAVGWSYDADGLRTGLTHPDGTATSYRRDGAGRRRRPGAPPARPARPAARPGRPAARPDRPGRARPAGATPTAWLTGHVWRGQRARPATRLTRDEHGRVVAPPTPTAGPGCSATTAPASSSAPPTRPASDAYTYDAAGRLAAETGPDGERDHTYDAAGQLTSSTGPDGPRHYRYDEAGRRVAEAGRGRPAQLPVGRVRPAHRRRHHHRRDHPSTPFRVDALGELAQVGDVAAGLGQRRRPPRRSSRSASRPWSGHGHPWAARERRCSTRLAAAPSGGGDRPVGPTRPGRGVGLGYRGELVVDGLVWLRERAYDPATRAFLSPDPLPAVPGTAYAANPYHYAGNDPVNQRRPARPAPGHRRRARRGARQRRRRCSPTIGHGAPRRRRPRPGRRRGRRPGQRRLVHRRGRLHDGRPVRRRRDPVRRLGGHRRQGRDQGHRGGGEADRQGRDRGRQGGS